MGGVLASGRVTWAGSNGTAWVRFGLSP